MVLCKKKDCKYKGFSEKEFPCFPCPDNPNFDVKAIKSNYSPNYLVVVKMEQKNEET